MLSGLWKVVATALKPDSPTNRAVTHAVGWLSERYGNRASNGDSMLRDALALERTRLANERTLLAYIRTALALLASAAALFQFFPNHPIFLIAAWILGLSGAVTLVIGARRFYVVKNRLGDE